MKRVLWILALVVLACGLLTLNLPRASAASIFFDDFEDGYAGWTPTGAVYDYWYAQCWPETVGCRGVQLDNTGRITRTVSTVGYTSIVVNWSIAAYLLEAGDRCLIEVNTGSGWSIIASVDNGLDDGWYRFGTVNLSAAANNKASFQVRYRILGNAYGDYCYVDNITISGTSGSPTATPTPTPAPTSTPTPTPTPGGGGSTVPGDPLTGSGSVSRSLLTYTNLISGTTPANPVNNSGYALPAAGAHPTHTFEGRLVLNSEATSGSFSEIRDDYAYTGTADHQRKHLPEFDYQFVQNGSHLIPVQRGLIITTHPYWNYILEAGRVWNETSDNGYSRASFPFALVEKNANCTHNGVMSFLFKNDGSVSKVWYQITQETCLYYKVNMWGVLTATYTPQTVSGSAAIRSSYASEVANRMTVKPISALATDFPGFDTSVLTSGITNITTYGIVYNGVNYAGICETRYGDYPFCSVMRLPSYSTAKSLVGGMAFTRLNQLYGTTVATELIRTWVPEYASGSGVWTNVTFNHTLDMATGNYDSSGYEVDEAGTKMGTFFDAQTYASKAAAAFSFPNMTTPGTTWVYHTSDTFLVTQAMDAYLESKQGASADIFQMLVSDVFIPLNIGPGAHTTLRTSENNWQGEVFGGFGLFLTGDDVAKLSKFLNVDDGKIGSTQVLHAGQLAAAMQQNASDRGLDTATQPFKYNNAFWGKQFTSADGYPCTFWTPFMSGFGGISVIMMPNGATFYVFSDNNEFNWSDVVLEAHQEIGSHCN